MPELRHAQIKSQSLGVFGEVALKGWRRCTKHLSHHHNRVALAALISCADNQEAMSSGLWRISGITMASAPPVMPAMSAR